MSDEIAIDQAEAAVGYGFIVLRAKIAAPVERALARVKLIREVVRSEVDLCADAN
jgi:L-alanine-DL-glutamate epimerase-like enolase superfamily enzyme